MQTHTEFSLLGLAEVLDLHVHCYKINRPGVLDNLDSHFILFSCLPYLPALIGRVLFSLLSLISYPKLW